MNKVDIAALVICAVMAIAVAMRGFVREILSKLGLILGALAAFLGFKPLGALIARFLSIDVVPEIIAAVVIFLAVFLVVSALERAFHEVMEAAHLGPVDHFFGFILGIAEGALIAALILAIVVNQPFIDCSGLVSGSWFYKLTDGFIQVARSSGHV